MKQKKLFYLICTLFIFAFASCSDDDDNHINKDQLPTGATSFLQQYLPDHDFVSATQYEIYGQYIYEVNLSGGILASFDTQGNWNLVQSEQGLPKTLQSLLSPQSEDKLAKDYPNARIITLSKYKNGDIFIALDNAKMFLDTDTPEGYTLATILDGRENIPDKVKLFISQYMTGINSDYIVLMYSGFRGNIYRLLITDKTVIDFYSDGEWFYMKDIGTSTNIQNFFIEAIPEGIYKVLTEQQGYYPISSLVGITRFNNNSIYGFDFGKNYFLAINTEYKIVDPPLTKIKEYIKQGFNPQIELQYNVTRNTSNAYFLRYAFKISGEGQINLVTDVEGNMRNISAGPISTAEGVSKPLPKAILEMLPNATTIMNYLETNYPDKEVIRISHSYSVSQEDIPEYVNLTIRIPNNLKILVFNNQTGEFVKEYNLIVE